MSRRKQQPYSCYHPTIIGSDEWYTLQQLVVVVMTVLVISVDTATVVADSAASVTTTNHGRLIIPLDYGWKHRTGLKDWALPNEPPPRKVDPGMNPKEAQINYDTKDWWTVQLPHDGLIGNAPSQQACTDGCSGQSFIPRHVLWYRKTIVLQDLPEYAYQLEFQGSFRNTSVWINGNMVKNHVCGYTPFTVPLTSKLLQIGEIGQGIIDTNTTSHHNQQYSVTIAVFVDPDNGDYGGPSRGSGWWYEGGGLYRRVKLIRYYRRIHTTIKEGLFVKSYTCMDNDTCNGHTLDTIPAILDMEATVAIADEGGSSPEDVCMQFVVYDYVSGTIIGTTQLRSLQIVGHEQEERTELLLFHHQTNTSFRDDNNLQREQSVLNSIATVSESFHIENAKLWTTSDPYLYRIDFVMYQNCDPNENERRQVHKLEVDRVTTIHGIRSIVFDSNHGFRLNQQPFKIRGFCDHDTFAVVGMALPDRINLFRAQASRSIGGNARRTSHNPPDPALLDIYDRLGMVVMDENRLFGNYSAYVGNMGDLVLRDRNHPSVIIWSFCNEVGCEGEHETGAPGFQNVTDFYDGTRPTLANMFTYNDTLSNIVTIQGFSHRLRDKLDECHAALPEKPILMSECCSCNTMRGEDEGCETEQDNPHNVCNQKAFNARCLELLVNASDGVDYSSGTFVWTLFDYYGEPPSAGLTVSSSYGQFDLCGFPKAAAAWFRTQWLLESPNDQEAVHRQDKPFDVVGLNEVYLVESWESPDTWNETKGNNSRIIHAYSNAPLIELFVNGKSQGTQSVSRMRSNAGTYTEFQVPWHPGNISAVAKATNGTVMATSSQRTNSRSHSLVLTLDCPSLQTGTGTSVYLDGQDVALVRATIVDTYGQPVHTSTHNITFQIRSGPGRIMGTANGDSHSYQPHNSAWQTAYHGLVRAIVQVTSIAGLDPTIKEWLRKIDQPSLNSDSYPSFDDDADIVLEAWTPGIEPASIRIVTSLDPQDSVLSVTAAAAGTPVNFLTWFPPNHEEDDYIMSATA